jgi:hypothetical protein
LRINTARHTATRAPGDEPRLIPIITITDLRAVPLDPDAGEGYAAAGRFEVRDTAGRQVLAWRDEDLHFTFHEFDHGAVVVDEVTIEVLRYEWRKGVFAVTWKAERDLREWEVTFPASAYERTMRQAYESLQAWVVAQPEPARSRLEQHREHYSW